MPLTNTAQSYGSVSRLFHWLTALLILTAIPLGLIAQALPDASDGDVARKALVFSLHKTVGVAVFLTACARILWAVTQTKPAPIHPDHHRETALAETVHWLLYASLVIVPLSGWMHHAALTGFAPILWPFGQTLPFVPQNPSIAAFFGTWHWLFTKVLGIAVFLHIAGAVKHALVDRDGTLARMINGRPSSSTQNDRSRRPALFAAGIWAAAIFGGSALALSGGSQISPTLSSAESQWRVQDGTLAFNVRQLGNPAQGRFDDWTAEIAFNDRLPGSRKGTVDVTISIPSLVLTGVADRALSADFFAADAFPVASYSAEIFAADIGYEARGTLTLKGISVPLTLPFTLDITDETATMSGRITVDRRDFDIGEQTYTDEKTLGYPVEILVDLTAIRTK